MSTTNWLLYLALAALLAGVAAVLYVRREPGGRGRFVAAALRGAALALALLLVFDPWLPGLVGGGRGRPQVVLDDSWSMVLPGADAGSSRWDAARTAARTADGRITLLGGDAVDDDALDGLAPRASGSRIVPAIRAALESGTRDIVLVSDGGVTDADEAARLIAAAGATLRVIDVAGAARNAAVAAVDAPRSARAGETVTVRIDVATLGMEGDSLRVTIAMGAVILGEATIAAPADGRIATATVPISLPSGSSDQQLALLARVEQLGSAGAPGAAGADAYPDDDNRPFFIDVEERPRGIVLLSVRPDWEPRFLIPALERSTGLPVRGYLRTPGGAYLTVGEGAGAARRIAEADVRRDLEGASVAVLHGVGAGAPAWVRDALAKPRVLVFPAAASGGALPGPLGVAAAAAAESGDWYVDARPAASPVAPLLAALRLEELPPLTSLRAGDVPAGAWAPLLARRDRRGGTFPVALAGGGGARRWVVATGSGYWRWALRGGESRRAYGLFWSAMLGWLTEDIAGDAGDAIRPDTRVVERGQEIVWRVGGEADSVRLQIDAGGASLDTLVEVGADRTARTRALEPGLHRWTATAGATSAAGELAVAAWSPEMVRPARDLSVLSARGATLSAGVDGRRRLHAQAWPWIVLVGLLCGEWVMRRRLGLR